MKKLALMSAFGIIASSSMWGAACSVGNVTGTAGSFTSATTATALIALGATGCTFGGYTLANFSLDNSFSDFAYGGDSQYNYLITPSNTDNYVVALGTAPDGFGLSLTVEGKVLQGDNLAPWTVVASTLDNPVFSFKLKYTISSDTNSVDDLKNLTLTGVGSNSAGLQAASTNTFKKAVEDGIAGPFVANLNLLVPTSGNFTNSLFATLNSTTSTLQVSDQILLSMNEPTTNGLSMSAKSITNIFDIAGQVPEPMTTALMGLGLAGLAMIRRRINKA